MKKLCLILSLTAGLALVLFIITFGQTYYPKPDKVMIIEGNVRPDSTNPNISEWTVTIFEHSLPPLNMSHLPPTGSKIVEKNCSVNGEYTIQLSTEELLKRNITKIVVYAHPNPNEGHGWKVIDVKSGTFQIDLSASNMPPLPSKLPSIS